MLHTLIRCGVDRHQAPEPVDLLSGLAADIEAGLRQAVLQFTDVERVYMGVASPGQYKIQQSHPKVVATPVCDDQIAVRGYHSPNFTQSGIGIREVMQRTCASYQLKVCIIER